MTAFIGANLAGTWTEDELKHGVGFALNDRYVGHDGKEYIFCKASGSITGAGYVLTIDETGASAMLSTSNDARGDRVGVALTAVASGSYHWAQVKGAASIRVAASAAANARLNTTATAGQIDDDGTASSMEVVGVYLTSANGGSPGNAPGILMDPYIGVTI